VHGFLVSLAMATSLLGADVHGVDTNHVDWMQDYGAALKLARSSQRPLLIIFERDSSPGRQIEQVAYTPDTTQSLLLTNYTTCRVDVGTEHGIQVAQAFKVTRFPYTVITDKHVAKIILRRHGNFTANEWISMLVDYQDGRRRHPGGSRATTKSASLSTIKQPSNCFS